MSDLAIKYVGNPISGFFGKIWRYLEIVGVIRTIAELERLGHYAAAHRLGHYLKELRNK